MARAVFDAVQQKLTDHWTTKTSIRTAGDHLLTGLLFDDAGHRMAPTHATKAGIRYRYYVSLPCLHGEAKTAKVGSVTRVPATEIEDVVLKSLNAYLRHQSGMPTITGQSAIAEAIDRIDVYKDRLAVRLRSRESPGTTELADDIAPTDDRLLSIPWQKPPSLWLIAKRGPAGAAGTAPPTGQRHRTRQALAGRDDLRIRQPTLSKLRCVSDAASVMST